MAAQKLFVGVYAPLIQLAKRPIRYFSWKTCANNRQCTHLVASQVKLSMILENRERLCRYRYA